MVTFVLLIGTLNFIVGYGLAMTLAPTANAFRFPALKLPSVSSVVGFARMPVAFLNRLREVRTTTAEAPAAAAPEAATAAAAETEPPTAAEDEPHPHDEPHHEPPPSVFDGMCQSWIQILTSAGIEPQSFVEAAVHILRLEVGRYREQLIGCETRARETEDIPDAAEFDRIRADIKRINSEWLVTQREAVKIVGERRGGMGDLEDTGRSLEDVLLDQSAQIETTSVNLEMMDLVHDPAAGKHLLDDLRRLIDLAHALRDRMQDMLAVIAGRECRVETIAGGFAVDPQTTLISRLGFQKLFRDWRLGDEAKMRLVSMVLVDLDRFGKLNERLGTRSCDRLLGAIGREMARFVRRDRGHDRVCRLAGQRFVLFLGDTGPRQALSAAERIRQSIEALSLECDGEEIEFTVTCGVCELTPAETMEEILYRLSAALREARKSGRNRTALDEGDGPKVVADPPRFQVKARIVSVKD